MTWLELNALARKRRAKSSKSREVIQLFARNHSAPREITQLQDSGDEVSARNDGERAKNREAPGPDDVWRGPGDSSPPGGCPGGGLTRRDGTERSEAEWSGVPPRQPAGRTTGGSSELSEGPQAKRVQGQAKRRKGQHGGQAKRRRG